MKNDQYTLQDLNDMQRSHLAWRLDHKTYCGLLTACSIARLEHEDYNAMPLFRLFMNFDMTERAAKIHAHKVINFPAGKNT